MKIAERVGFAKAVIKTGVNQMRTEKLCLIGCRGSDGSVCVGRAENPRMIKKVNPQGMVTADAPQNFTFLVVTCPVIRDPKSKIIG